MSVDANLAWINRDGRPYVDVMALEVLIRDFAQQLADDGDPWAADQVLRLADALAAIVSGEKEARL